jgi:NAD(P)-dependent dehydrogenase (short-subunit alcohol dehydrogenase family)
VVGRDPTRTHALADELGVRGVTADFTSLASVRRLAEDLLAVNPRIDVLLDNAGAAVPASRPTVDGNEPNYQVNALAPFLLIVGDPDLGRRRRDQRV